MFDTPPLALHVTQVYDVSTILGRVTIDGEETFETNGDELIVHDQQSNGKSVSLTARVNAGGDLKIFLSSPPYPTSEDASFEIWFKHSDL